MDRNTRVMRIHPFISVHVSCYVASLLNHCCFCFVHRRCLLVVATSRFCSIICCFCFVYRRCLLVVATSRLCSIIVALVSFIVVACSSSAALSVKFKFWKMPGKCNLNDKWFHLVEYRSWLQKVTENPHKALSMKQIDIASGGSRILSWGGGGGGVLITG